MTSGADWVDQARRLLDAVRAGAGPDAGEHGGDDCRWCPVCQVAAVLRGERPEVTAALADVLTTAATALLSAAARGARNRREARGRRPIPRRHAPSGNRRHRQGRWW